MKLAVRTLIASIMTLAFVAPASARECADVTLPNSVNVNGTPLTLNGMGVREATVFNVNVYVAGLYLQERSRDGNAIINSNETKRLVLRFVRDVSNEDMRDALLESFGSNGGRAMQAEVRQLAQMLPNEITEGTTLTFTYTPDEGLEVRVGSRARGTIAGQDFARVFFRIYLGPNPPNAGLKTGLLGGTCSG